MLLNLDFKYFRPVQGNKITFKHFISICITYAIFIVLSA